MLCLLLFAFSDRLFERATKLIQMANKQLVAFLYAPLCKHTKIIKDDLFLRANTSVENVVVKLTEAFTQVNQ